MPDLAELLAKSKATDSLALLKAKEAAKKKMLTDPNPATLTVMEKANAGLEKLTKGQPGHSFSTQLEAVEYLNGQGYQIKKSKFNSDFKKGFIPKSPDGFFDAATLLGYAKSYCKTLAKAEDQAAAQANLERTKADADNKRIAAERGRLKLEQELGRLIPREEHETDLAARAAFFKREVETFGLRLGPRLIQLVGGEENKLENFMEFWREESAVWLDAWSADREFVLERGLAEDMAEKYGPPSIDYFNPDDEKNLVGDDQV